MIHGVLLLNKESGPTSHDQIAALRTIFKQKKIGHGGTLDPIAEGLLVVLLGKATKLSHFLLSNDKSYLFTFQLGVQTDTLDRTGTILKENSISHLDDRHIRQTLETQTQGRLLLPVPLFSAVKVKGKKLYQYARKDQKITPPVKEMYFYNLNILAIQPPKVTVELSCSKGAYIRSWVSHVGKLLHAGACLNELTRLSSHPFKLENAKTLRDIEEIVDNHNDDKELFHYLKPSLHSFSKALPHIMAKHLNSVSERDVLKGCVTGALLSQLNREQQQVNRKGEQLIYRLIGERDGEMKALVSLRPYNPPTLLKIFH